jgi:hypothetical protein
MSHGLTASIAKNKEYACEKNKIINRARAIKGKIISF